MEVFIGGVVGTSQHTTASSPHFGIRIPCKRCLLGRKSQTHSFVCSWDAHTIYIYSRRLLCQWIEGDPMLHPMPGAGDTSPCLPAAREPHILALQCWVCILLQAMPILTQEQGEGSVLLSTYT